MKLIEAQATNYRNIIDTNPVAIGQTTCLVGKNEAGKTAFLKALEGINSTDSKFAEYGKVTNYPRRYLAEYDQTHRGTDALVMRTVWRLDPDEIKLITDDYGVDSVTGDTVIVTKSYDEAGSTWTLPFLADKALDYLIEKHKLTPDDRAALSTATTTIMAAKSLAEIANKTPAQQALLHEINQLPNNDAESEIINFLDKIMPKFMYFSHYDRMSGELSINKVNKDKQLNIAMPSGDRVFLDFLEYAGTTLGELAKTTQFEDLNAKCEAAANRITDQIFDYWSQNDELKIKILLSEGKSGDPVPFNDGPVARARVENNLHGVSVPFSERSAGFIWFFSFLVKFAQIKKTQGNVILLLDEPGLTLHGTAQLDLLRYFYKEIAPYHQVIWSTHSPFMVPPNDLASVRTVEDVVTIDGRNRKKSIGTKIRSDVLTTDPQTNFPIFGAMGFEITQTLMIGRNTLLVEGPSDILYLQAASIALKVSGRRYLSPHWAVCPSGGIDKVLPFVRLFYGNNLNIVVLTDFERGQRKKLDDLHKAALLDDGRIILATDIVGKEEADIEDFFDPALFVDIVNKTYDLQNEHKLTIEKLESADTSTTRIVKKAEAYFRLLPADIPEYSHLEPSMYLLQHSAMLNSDEKPVQDTLARFERAFERISKFI